jgi:hypothetical protein
MNSFMRKLTVTVFALSVMFSLFGATTSVMAADPWYAVITNVTNIKCQPNGIFYTPYYDRNLPAGSTYSTRYRLNGVTFASSSNITELYNLQYMGEGYGYIQWPNQPAFATGYTFSLEWNYSHNGSLTSTSFFEVNCPTASGVGTLKTITYNKDAVSRTPVNPVQPIVKKP